MSFGNVTKDLNITSLATMRSTASKNTNGFFSANIQTVGSLVQYELSPDVWVTAESITVPATQLGDNYALPSNIVQKSFSRDGTTLAVSLFAQNPGDSILSILTNTSGTYNQESFPIPPDAVTPEQGSVSLNDAGNILALGSLDDNAGSGAVWLYAKIAGVWTLQGSKLTRPDGGFGVSVSLNGAGNLLAVGCIQQLGQTGSAYIFDTSTLAAPVFVAKLVGTIPGETILDFGFSINFSADGSTLAVGAPNIGTLLASFAFIFTKVQGTWTQQAYFAAPVGYTIFGGRVSLSVDGNIMAVSSYNNAVIYYRSPGAVGQSAWSAGIVLPLPYDYVGEFNGYFASLSQDGITLCTSSAINNNNAGASWIFTQGPLGTWTQNGPGFVSIPNPATVLSGDGKVAACSNIYYASNLLCVFV